MRLYFIFIFIIFLFGGCTAKKDSINLAQYPQNPINLCKNECDRALFAQDISKKASDDLVKKYFSPWSKEPQIAKSDLWGVDYTRIKDGYGKNLLLYTQKEKDRFIKNADADNYPSLSKDAILVVDSDFRVMPTDEPFFYNPLKAGEGYPFDYFQNSRVYTNTPLKVVHRSLDGEWVYAVSYFVKGWVRVKNLVFVDDSFKESFQTQNLGAITQEPFLLKDSEGYLIERLHIGVLLPYKDDKLYLAQKHSLESPYIIKFEAKQGVVKLPLTPSSQNFSEVLESLIGEKYSWGGKGGGRDCSMMIRDVFVPFGVFMPRNSKAQALYKNGKYVDVSHLSPTQKIDFLLDKAKPYTTLLYKKGHIMLYVGVEDGKPMIVHDLWGIKTDEDGDDGRYIVGQTALTPLDIGINLKNAKQDSLIINQIEGVKFLELEEEYE